jgi:hypothetical protein
MTELIDRVAKAISTEFGFPDKPWLCNEHARMAIAAMRNPETERGSGAGRSEMMERVARVLYEHFGDLGDKFYAAEWETSVIDAIAALRDPTPEMVNVGVSVVNFLRPDDAKLVWQVMIDALLAEKETGWNERP